MLPKYRQLIKAGVKILVYSGDVDGIVPFPGTRNWLALLNLPVRSPQRPWYSDHQVGGYITEYDGLTFACVPLPLPLISLFFSCLFLGPITSLLNSCWCVWCFFFFFAA